MIELVISDDPKICHDSFVLEDELLDYAISCCNLNNPVIYISRNLTLLAFRVCIKRKIISHNRIQLVHYDNGVKRTIFFNEDGRLDTSDYPFPTLDNFLIELL